VLKEKGGGPMLDAEGNPLLDGTKMSTLPEVEDPLFGREVGSFFDGGGLDAGCFRTWYYRLA
jgi:hypothetical protein